MVGTRNKTKQNEAPPVSNCIPSPLFHLFHTLVSAAAAPPPNGLNPSFLRKLYYLLVELSRNRWSCMKVGTDLAQLDYEIVPSGMRVTSKDMCRLSDILFKEFCKRFKQLHSDLCVSSASEGNKQAISHPDTLASAAELYVLLRCCLKIQDLLKRQNIHDENGQSLFMIARTLSQLVSSAESSTSFGNSYSSINNGNKGSANSFAKEFVAFIFSLKLTDSCIPVLSSIIEVFVDELSLSGQLEGYFNKIDYVSSTSYELSMDYLGDGNLKIMMELICAHFFLFIFNEQNIENLLARLSWPLEDLIAPGMSVTAALSLLHKPHMLCLPKLIQTHMISLVSEAVGFNLDFDHSIPDLKLIDHYLLTFRRSIILYADHIAKLQIDGCPEHNKFYFLNSNISGHFFPVFESCIQPATREKISNLNTNFSDSWDSHYRERFLRSKDDLSTSAITYMEDNLCILDRSCRDEILSVLSCIIRRVSDDIDSVLFDACDDASIHDVCFLTSLVNLMSISLLQSLWCLRSRCIGRLKSENLSCKEYQCIASIADSFTALDINLPITNSVCNLIESQLTKHKKSKPMLFHFLRLLSFGFLSGVDFLVNGCILCIMAIMNLFVFEEGNLEALKLVVDIGYQFPQQAARRNISTSLVVATKFQKIHSLYLSKIPPSNFKRIGQLENCSLSTNHDNLNAVATEETPQNTPNGVNYLRCIGEISAVDDLADFIECKEGKDYSSWLKNRDRYRKWKHEKHAALVLKKKKRAKGKKI
ncbi:uncharacterized protein LOC108213140 isoform X2 [Daucus carota subsp. sativus]|uniref:uncharacterized protein LOC108213140 isoform X2 n=1 Tax=Daucus carota subsp. sativus TaxID=79200 RepID=UPI0007F018B4|nr:PREDICTED: uncharacterized protein LOC108213140 isoform X1 [Daucus carota subsp. sativus]